MSMPSSRLDVATTQRSRPDLRSSSTRARCSLLTEPWCDAREHGRCAAGDARRTRQLGRRIAASAGGRRPVSRGTKPSPAVTRDRRGLALGPELVEPRREPLGESPGVREHDRRAVLEHLVEDRLFDVRPDRARAGLAGEVGEVVDGHDHPQVEPLARRRCDDRRPGRVPHEEPRDLFVRAHGRGEPDALRRARGELRRAARARARGATPRLVPASAWISSTMTVSTPRSVSRAAEVSMRKSDSGVVMRMSGGCVTRARRSAGGVSPERTPTDTSGTLEPVRGRRAGDARRAARGGCARRRRRAPSAARGRGPRARSSPRRRCSWCSRSIAQRNAASVLPEPVGATTSE